MADGISIVQRAFPGGGPPVGFRKTGVDVAIALDVKKMLDRGLHLYESAAGAVLIDASVPIECISRIEMRGYRVQVEPTQCRRC